jgi:uncharacterized membrane protein
MMEDGMTITLSKWTARIIGFAIAWVPLTALMTAAECSANDRAWLDAFWRVIAFEAVVGTLTTALMLGVWMMTSARNPDYPP